MVLDENQMQEILLTGRRGKWHVYYTGNLARDCQQTSDAMLAGMAQGIRNYAWSAYESGRAYLAYRHAGGKMEYMIARRR